MNKKLNGINNHKKNQHQHIGVIGKYGIKAGLFIRTSSNTAYPGIVSVVSGGSSVPSGSSCVMGRDGSKKICIRRI